MSSESEHPIQTAGFWIFGLISMVLAVLKWTVAPYWSWWRVMLPLLAYLGHNALYILTALICFRWLKHEEEDSTTADEHARDGYNIAGLLFFFLFLDNLFRHIEGQGWGGFWPCSRRVEVVVLYAVLSLLAQLAYWSRIAVLIKSIHRCCQRGLTHPAIWHDFFDHTG
jgi:hypothetical protein